MIWIVSLLLSFTLGTSQTLPATGRTLVAEGDYVAQTKTGDKPLSHWQLWHLSDGGYEVVDTNVKNASSVQIFRFDSHFLPIGYIRKLGPVSKTQNSNVATLPGWTISCQYESKELSCDDQSSDGRKSTTSIAAEAPYVVTGEFYDLDFAWFMTGIVHLASRNGTKDGVVNAYALTDGAKAGDIGLEPDSPIRSCLPAKRQQKSWAKRRSSRNTNGNRMTFPCCGLLHRAWSLA